MSCWRNNLLLIANLLFGFPLEAFASVAAAILDTSYGQLTGKSVDLGVRGVLPVNQYLGIPYGIAPEGNRRYLPPQNAAKWLRSTKDATKLPPVCIQNLPNISDESAALERMTRERYEFLKRLQQDFLKDQREDCLYMNYYLPALRSSGKSSSDKLPVIVIVHGESFEWNAGNPYDGSVLAGYGELIVVTINYRLGALGFLSSGDPVVSGNRALHDVLAALNMIHLLATDFEADTNKITLLGFGTGAALVNLLLSAPAALPADIQLFQRAVILGGSALSKWAMVENPREFFYLFAEQAGCATMGPNKLGIAEFLSPAAILPCLQQLPVENVTRAQRHMPNPTFLSTFAPVLDGIFVVKDPKDNLRFHGDLYHRYDVLFGVKNEYNLLNEADISAGMTPDRRSKIYRTLARNLFSFHRTEILDAIINQYTDWTNANLTPKEVTEEVLTALSDGLYNAPLIQATQFHAQNEQSPTPSSRTYLYVFSHQTKETGFSGLISNDDLPYILGYPLTRAGQLNIPFNVSGYTAKDKIVSEILMRYVSNFAKSGDPNLPDESGEFVSESNSKLQEKLKTMKWPAFDVPAQKEQYLSISEKPKTGHFFRAQQMAFWTKFLPKLHLQLEGHTDAEHHFLPNHRKMDSFFGEVFPLGGYFSSAFTPPPLPPPVMPQDVVDYLAKAKAKQAEDQAAAAASAANQSAAQAATNANEANMRKISEIAGTPNTILSVTVAVGCALLVLNILLFAAIYHQKDKNNRRKKQQLGLQYQSSYTTASGAILNSPTPTSQQQQQQVPLCVATSSSGTAPFQQPSLLHGAASMQTTSASMSSYQHLPTQHLSSGNLSARMPMQTFHHDAAPALRSDNSTSSTFVAQYGSRTGGAFAEQQPLLGRTNASVGEVSSSGIALPSSAKAACPRHGRSPGRTTMEEIQV